MRLFSPYCLHWFYLNITLQELILLVLNIIPDIVRNKSDARLLKIISGIAINSRKKKSEF